MLRPTPLATLNLLQTNVAQLLRAAVPAARRHLKSNSLNEPGPVFKEPERAVQQHTGHTKLIGRTGPVFNMDIKTTTETLSDAFHRHRHYMPFLERSPIVSAEAFVAPTANVIGNVELHDKVFVWSGAVIRGDENAVEIGAQTTIGENTIITADCELTDMSLDTDGEGGRVGDLPGSTLVGVMVTVEANCVLRACTIEHSVVIGAGSVICEGALIEAGAIIDPGSVVPPGRRVPAGQRWGGSPVVYIEDSDHGGLERNDEISQQMYFRSISYKESYYPLHEYDYSMLHNIAKKAYENGH